MLEQVQCIAIYFYLPRSYPQPQRESAMEDNWLTHRRLLLLLGPALFFGLAVKELHAHDWQAQPVRAQFCPLVFQS